MKRVIFSDNSTLNDYSPELYEYSYGTGLINFVAAEDALYIGSMFPFNSLYLKVNSPNAATSTPTVAYWDGSNWNSMVDVIDETANSGVPLARSGHMTWTTDKNEAWQRDDTVSNTGSAQVTGLGSVTIYDLYWLKITYSADLTSTTKLDWVGPMFCNDEDLYGEYSFFSDADFKTGFESGKVDWEEQRVIASRLVIEDLESKNVVFSGDQLLERRRIKSAAVTKTAQVIFNNLGDDYRDDVKTAREEYYKRLGKQNYSADKNSDARLNVSEKKVRTGGLFR